jgi:hypothetical protein
MLTLAGSQCAVAAEFTLFIYETPAEVALRNDRSEAGQAYWAAYGAYAKALEDSQIIRGGAPLQSSETGKVVAVVDGKPAISDGAYASSELTLGGYFKIDVATESDAIAWAARAPAAARGGRVEVRPSFPAPQM